MTFFLYGQDTYRMQGKLNEMIEEYKKAHKGALSLKSFGEDNLNLDDVKIEVQTASIFQEKKLIIFKNVLSLLKKEPRFPGLLEEFQKSDDIIIFSEEKEFDEKNDLVKFLKKNAKSQEFRLLEGEKLKKWAEEEFLKFRKEISAEALDKLVSFTGNDLWQLSNDIKKLVNFQPEGKIEEKNIELLVKPTIELDIFRTIDAIAEKNKKRALFLIHKHLERGDNPVYLLSMINFQFRNLLIIKDLIEKRLPYYSILKTAKLHPFVVRKTYQQAGKFTFQEIKKIYRKIFQADLDIKTGKVSAETALDLLLTEF